MVRGQKRPKRGASKEGIRALLGSGSGAKAETEVEGVEGRDEVVERAVEEALRSPRVTVHSPLTSAVMRYLKLLRPGFSISSTLRELLEEAIKERYPEEFERVREVLLERKERELRRRLGID